MEFIAFRCARTVAYYLRKEEVFAGGEMARRILDRILLSLLALSAAGYFFVYKPYADRQQREQGERQAR
jgi:hypothetical protein